MSNKSIDISLNHISKSMVLNRKLIDRDIWTGTIDSDLVDEFLVADESKRIELKKLIKMLEQSIIDYRKNGFENNPAKYIQEYNRIQDLSLQIHSILTTPSIDIIIYLVNLINKFDRIKAKNPEELSTMNSACITEITQNRKILLNHNSAYVYPVYYPEKDEYGFELVTIKEQETKLKRNGNIDKLIRFIHIVYGDTELKEDDELVALDNINENILITDVLESLISPSLKSIVYQTILRNYLLKTGMSKEEINTLSLEELKEISDSMYLEQEKEIYRQIITDILIEYVDYFSIDKFILAYLQRSIEEYSRSAQLTYTLQELIEESKILQGVIKRIVDSKIVSNTVNTNVATVSGEKRVNLKNIRTVQKEFIDDLYITPDIESFIKEMLFLNNYNLQECSENIIMKLNYSQLDYEIIALVNFENLKRLYDFGKINKLFINRLVRNCSLDIYTSLQEKSVDDFENPINSISFPSKMELITYLFTNELIGSKDLYEYYLLNQIELEELEQLENSLDISLNFANQMKEQIDDFDFLARYKEFVQARLEYENALKNDDLDINSYKINLENKRKEKDKLLMIYRKYKLNNLSEEEKEQFINETLLYYCIENEENIVIESLRELYKDSIISLENIQSLDSSYLQKIVMDTIFARGELNLDDTYKVRESLSPNVLKELIKNIVKDPGISRSQKFILIMNVYNLGTEEDIKTADELLEELKLTYDGTSTILPQEQDKSENKKKKQEELKKEKSEKIHNNIEWVYPKHIKWKFLKALDKEAEIKLYTDGYVEVYSKKLNVRIIERYFESDSQGDDFGRDAYGYATYILSEEDYRKNFDVLIGQKVCKVMIGGNEQKTVEDFISRKNLTSIVSRENRIRHNTQSQSKNWMREMAKYFNIDLESELDLVNDTRYTKEELEHLREIIKIYENSYIDRNAER